VLGRLAHDDGLRFIPAPAGNGGSIPSLWHQTPVHPRACGERIRDQILSQRLTGSSPRLRGTVLHRGGQHPPLRFIPAPAGNGYHRVTCAPARSVHPRACGERRLRVGLQASGLGSSPRLRGTVSPLRLAACKRRFIPAPAGNGPQSGGNGRGLPVHPRACGERGCLLRWRRRHAGSSPRLRGTEQSANTYDQNIRFIPAPAGNGSLI